MKETPIKIFISYRQSDTEQIIFQIFKSLRTAFGADCVFLDSESIRASDNFRDALNKAIEGCNVLIAVIGKRWLGEPKGNEIDPPIFDSEDWINFELTMAMAAGKHVIPVLINDAKMPKANEIPASLREFAYVQAVPLSSGRDFDAHINNLIKVIQDRWGNAAQTKRERALRAYRAKVGLLMMDWFFRLCVLLVAGFAAYLLVAKYVFRSEFQFLKDHPYFPAWGPLMIMLVFGVVGSVISDSLERRFLRRYDRTSGGNQ